jgi:Xaa-Pro aminopeptidase
LDGDANNRQPKPRGSSQLITEDNMAKKQGKAAAPRVKTPNVTKKSKLVEPKVIRLDDVNPDHRWHRPLQAPGHTQVDFEERVDFRRLHAYRLARVRAALANSGLGALLSFDQYNIRYTTSTVIGEWARDKLLRYSLLTGNGDPYIWDFGSAAKHHRLYAPWLHEDHCRAGMLGMRGAVGADRTLFRDAAKEIRAILEEEGVADMPVGVDVIEPPMMFELQNAGIDVRDGQQTMLLAREVKSHDEITLLNMAAAMVDGVYQDISEALKPGVKESEIVALATSRLYEMGSDNVEAINSISGERCSPHPHNFTDRLIRPGDQAFFDVIQSFIGYRTCYYRTFAVGRATGPQRTAYKKARDWMDSTIELLKPGMSSDVVAKALPTAKDIGFASEMDAFGLNFCHGLGLGLHERPLISRVTSFREPIELKVGMVFAVETYCPATDGVSAARIEEEVVLTPDGAKIITLFPAEELPIANPY